jgi:tetratricopeptide (TPR) repeat protein
MYHIGGQNMKYKILLAALLLSFTLLCISCKSTSDNNRVQSEPASLVLSSEPDTDIRESNITESEKVQHDITDPIGEPAMKKAAPPVYETTSDEEYPAEARTATPKHLDADNYYNIGISLYNTGHYEDAAGAFKKTLDINPDYTRAHYDLALSHIMLDDHAAAFDEYKKLQGLNQDMANNLRKAAVHAVSANSNYKLIVQVGAFRVLKNAEKLINDLKDDYLFLNIDKTGSLYKVLIHGVRTMEEGKLIMQDIKKKHNIVPFMIIRE